MDFTFISRFIDIFLMIFMLESFNKLSIQHFIKRLPVIIIFSYLILRYGIYYFDTFHNLPLMYWFYNDISLFLFFIILFYSVLFYKNEILNNIFFCAFIVFNNLLLHTLILFIGSLWVESPSFFVYSESLLYYLLPFTCFLLSLIESYLLRFFHLRYINIKLIILFICLFFLDIIIMNYLGYMYIFHSYKSIFMFINIILIILITCILLLLIYYIKKYYEALMSHKVYNEAKEFQENYEKLINEQYQLIQSFHHDYKYYLLKMKHADDDNNIEEFQKTIDSFIKRYEKIQWVHTDNLLLDYLFNQKIKEANNKDIHLSYLIVGKRNEYIKEYDLYYVIDNILNILFNNNCKDIDFRMTFKDSVHLQIKIDSLNKKNQEQILINIKPVLDQYHGFAFFDKQDQIIIFNMTLCIDF